mgnify:CR=1 FL=1
MSLVRGVGHPVVMSPSPKVARSTLTLAHPRASSLGWSDRGAPDPAKFPHPRRPRGIYKSAATNRQLSLAQPQRERLNQQMMDGRASTSVAAAPFSTLTRALIDRLPHATSSQLPLLHEAQRALAVRCEQIEQSLVTPDVRKPRPAAGQSRGSYK